MSAEPAAPTGFTDHTFKSASGVELAVRVWPAETPVTQPAPFVLWYVPQVSPQPSFWKRALFFKIIFMRDGGRLYGSFD
jgi:hypothetical protein